MLIKSKGCYSTIIPAPVYSQEGAQVAHVHEAAIPDPRNQNVLIRDVGQLYRYSSRCRRYSSRLVAEVSA